MGKEREAGGLGRRGEGKAGGCVCLRQWRGFVGVCGVVDVTCGGVGSCYWATLPGSFLLGFHITRRFPQGFYGINLLINCINRSINTINYRFKPLRPLTDR